MLVILATQSTQTYQECGCIISERNLLEIMHMVCVECNRNAIMHVGMLKVALKATRLQVWKAVFAAGVNEFSTTIFGLVTCNFLVKEGGREESGE